MDTSHGTHVGSSDPFVDELGKESNQTEADTDPIIKEGNGDSVVYDHPNDQNKPEPGIADVETEDGDPFVKTVNEDVNVDDAAGFEEDDDFNDVPFPDVENDDEDVEVEDDWYEPEEDDYEIEVDDNDAYNDENSEGFTVSRANKDIEDLRRQLAGDFDNDFNDDFEFESRRHRGKRLSEEKLNVFGKHPAWRKQPMTTPPNKEVAINGAREWDDESAQGEQPYAEKIGDGSPFDQVVRDVTESVIKSMFSNKKKA
jgi:hypothetical protein